MDSEFVKNKIKKSINYLISKNFFSKSEIEYLFSDECFCSSIFGISSSVLFPASFFQADYCNYHIFSDWTEEQLKKFIKWKNKVEHDCVSRYWLEYKTQLKIDFDGTEFLKESCATKDEVKKAIKELISRNLFSEPEIQNLLSDKDFVIECLDVHILHYFCHQFLSQIIAIIIFLQTGRKSNFKVLCDGENA